MKRLYPAQLLNELLKDNSTVLVITTEKLNKLTNELHKHNIDCRNCSFDVVSDYVKQVVFNKHQSVISENEIHLLNNSEVRNRIYYWCDMYNSIDNIEIIRKYWT